MRNTQSTTWVIVAFAWFVFRVYGTLPKSLASPSAYGCKFSRDLCLADEVCVEDNLFGSCQKGLASGASIDRYQYVLDVELRGLLEAVMADLVQDGYSWRHERTQCVIGAVLLAYRLRDSAFDLASCEWGRGTSDDADAMRLLDAYLRDLFAAESQSPEVDTGRSGSSHGLQQQPDRLIKSSIRDPNEAADDTLTPKDLKTLELFLEMLTDSSAAGASLKGPRKDIPEPSAEVASGGALESAASVHTAYENEVLIGRLLKDELSVNELSIEEIMRLTNYASAMLQYLKTSPAPVPARQLPTMTSTPGDSREADSLRANRSAFALYVAEMMFNEARNKDVSTAVKTSISRGEPIEFNYLQNADQESEQGDTYVDGSSLDDAAAKRVGSVSSATTSAPITSLPYDVVDASYGWVMFEKSVTLDSIQDLLAAVVRKLGIGNESLSDLRVIDNEVIFRVHPNDRNVNATTFVKAVSDEALITNHGGRVAVQQVGLGNAAGRLELNEAISAVPKSHRLVIVTSAVTGCVIAVIVGGAVLYSVGRRRAHKLRADKLKDADTTGGAGSLLAHDEYEDLMRQERTGVKVDGAEGGADTGAAGPATADDHGSSRSGSASSWSEEPATANMDISTGHMVLSYMEDHLKNKERLDSEWRDLCSYEADPCSTDVASLVHNRKKNRYLSVLPYDHKRVALNAKANVVGEDYINASFIADHDPRTPAYIAAQGPLADTVADFWQMVWEQGVVVMVMLTRLSEGNMALCHRYWPHTSSELYHIYEVHLVSEHVWSEDYLVRSFYLKNHSTNETRTVTQFHYLAWPENGVPAVTKSLLDFRRKVNKSYRGRSRPVVVMCSDGSGRTGAFILLDMVINRMNKGAKEIDLAATLEFIRDQRMGTVKTQEQFEFVLTSVAEEVQAVLRAMPR